MIFPSIEVEDSLWERGLLRIVGVDEAGLGSLSGPVVAAAVLLPPNCSIIDGVRDSKTLTAAQRERLFVKIKDQAVAVGIGAASVAEIDQLNVLQATHLAMGRALARIGQYDHALVDGREITKFNLGPHTAIVKGDALSYVIACASIIAKVRRDRFMKRLSGRYPGYGWEHNAGYGTKKHIQAMWTLGITPFHRRTYAPVRKVLNELEAVQTAPTIR